MIQNIRRTNQFKKDVRRMGRRGKDLHKLKQVISLLASDDTLASRHRDHELTGSLKGIRDLHLEPDWILLYQISANELILIRTGSHSDLFRQ